MKKIMVVDDENIFQYLAKTMLEPTYEVVCAQSGEEALECFEKEAPDLVLSDLMMPGMSGLEFQDKLKQKYGDKIPVVFMTSDYRQEAEIDSFRGGAADFIHKPFQKEILLRRLEIILSGISRIEDLQEEASTDLLTGLLNKVYVEKEITDICKNSFGTLMLMDLDSFKLVNDYLGHDVGDQVLKKFAGVLHKVVRSKDIAGRIGGDEFIIFCSNVNSKNVIEQKAEQITDMFDTAVKDVIGKDGNIPLGVSIGAVNIPYEGREFPELFKKADKALQSVKQHGKHGLSIYKNDSVEEESVKCEGLVTGRAILDERNEPNGAFEVSAQSFRDVYRFLKRAVKNYNNTVQYGIFTIDTDGRDELLEDAMDSFGKALKCSLRCSDTYTKNGSNQYWLLLPESNTEDAHNVVLKRIMDNWHKDYNVKGVTVNCDIEDI